MKVIDTNGNEVKGVEQDILQGLFYSEAAISSTGAIISLDGKQHLCKINDETGKIEMLDVSKPIYHFESADDLNQTIISVRKKEGKS